MTAAKKTRGAKNASATWPAARRESWPVGRLRPYAGNSRSHSAEQIAEVAQAIREFGWTDPILVLPDGTILSGHCRHAAALKLGLGDVPVMIAEGWSDAQVKKYVIWANRSAEKSTWNEAILATELAALSAMGEDLALTGFDDDEAADLIAALEPEDEAPEEADADAVPGTLKRAPVTRPGDVWLLGPHRLACGDPKDDAIREAACGDGAPDLLVAQTEDEEALAEVLAGFGGTAAYVWCGALAWPGLAARLEAARLRVANLLAVPTKTTKKGGGSYRPAFETGLYAARARGHKFRGATGTGTLWSFAPEGDEPDRLPVAALERCVRDGTKAGPVLDPFGGLGGTLIAAERAGVPACLVVESPADADRAVERWQRYAEGEACREGDGRAFASLCGEVAA